MVRIAITGAGGTVGRETVDALREHDVTAITHRDHDDLESVVVDIENKEAVKDALAGHDTIVHLAAAASTDSSWKATLNVNIDGTRNVYEAASTTTVERVVFASTNHVSHAYNIGEPGETPTLTDQPQVVTPTDPPRPDSYYGISKIAGEALGSYYADNYDLEVVNLRIGWLLTREELAETQAQETQVAKYARAMWLSPRDWKQLISQAVTTSLSSNLHTVHAISQNDDRYLSLTETLRSLGYQPRDNSTEALAEH